MTTLTNEELANIESTREPTGMTRRDDLHNVIARTMKQPVYNSSEICDAVEQYLERLPSSPAPTPTPLTEEERKHLVPLARIADWGGLRDHNSDNLQVMVTVSYPQGNQSTPLTARTLRAFSDLFERLSASPTVTPLTRRDDLHNVIARIMQQPIYNSSAICDAVEQYLDRLSASATAMTDTAQENERV